MDENKIKGSCLLKTISMVLLPLFIIIAIATMLLVMFVIEEPEVKTNTSFYETNNFADTYMNQIYQNIRESKTLTKTVETLSETEEGTTQLQRANVLHVGEDTIYYDLASNYKEQGFKYLLVDEQNKVAYTNVPQTTATDTISKIIQYINENSKRWTLENGVVDTTIDKLSMDQIKYDGLFGRIEEKAKGSNIYTAYDEKVLNTNLISSKEVAFNIVAKTYSISFVLLPISIVISFILGGYLIISTGHKKGQKEISLSWFDRIPLEVSFVLGCIIICVEVLFIAGSYGLFEINVDLCITFMALTIYLLTITSVYLLGSIIKRIKAKQFFKNSLVYRIWKWMKTKVQHLYEMIIYDPSTTGKIAVCYVGFILISIILAAFSVTGIGVLLLLAFWIWTFSIILKQTKNFYEIKQKVQDIYEGKTDIHINEEELKGVLKEMAKYVNDIAGGFSNAIEQSLKSERLKTELITNVSHDIKTPLTSIINYVDLLKKEEILDEKTKEYLDILDKKSQRLKKLTEDLVEASKASSGNIKLNKEKLNVTELVKQITGEFEDKFKDNQLEIILDLPKENTSIIADNRYVYRVIENLYSNIAKYALPGSRVYVDVLHNGNKTMIAIKNISKDKLNITADELMQRFVRGDQSRNTEGSGLGLSIAQSLTELQGGTFSIYLDGDLFKVVLEFETK